MNQIEEREKFLENFGKMSFINKKKECLEILKKLYGISEDINTLGNIVYNQSDENNQEILLQIYTLLLDALYYAKDKQEERAVESLEKAKNSFNNLKQEEESERALLEQNLDDLIDKLDF